MRPIVITALSVLSIATALLAGTAQGEVKPHADKTQSGRQLFDRFGCYACHGHVGAGGTAGPALAGRGLTKQYVFDYARKPGGTMPPFRQSVLSDPDLRSIADYVARLPGAKPVSQVPALSRMPGWKQ